MTQELSFAAGPRGPSPRPVVLRILGRTRYEDALALQRELQSALRSDSTAYGVLLLTEHDPVFTLGRNHPVADLRVPASTVAAAGIPIIQVERGGDITYHGPGQLVIYPIINLRVWGLGAVDFVNALEEVALQTLGEYGITAQRRPSARGAWVGTRKIASIGVNVRGGVSMHGMALNVDPDLGHFAMINACGLGDVEITSIVREGGGSDLPGVTARLIDAFQRVFECTFEPPKD